MSCSLIQPGTTARPEPPRLNIERLGHWKIALSHWSDVRMGARREKPEAAAKRAVVARPFHGISGDGQRLADIGDKVVRVLDADRQPYCRLHNADPFPNVFGH